MAELMQFDLEGREDGRCSLSRKDNGTWQIGSGEVKENTGQENLILSGDVLPEAGFTVPEKIERIIIEVDTFVDGRCFSLVRKLREEFQFTNRITLSGSFIHAQLVYFSNLGVDDFEFTSEQEATRGKAILDKESERFRYRAKFAKRRERE